MPFELHCVVYHDQVINRVYVLQSIKNVIIGRKKSCDILLPDAYVSRRHASIEHIDDGTVIRDMKSRNGTTLNGQSIHGDHMVRDGDVVQIGPYRLILLSNSRGDMQQVDGVDHSTLGRPGSKSNLDRRATSCQPRLTPSQDRVLEGFVDGLSEKEIAIRLGLSIHTVHTHAKAIYKSYAIASRGELLKAWADGRSNGGELVHQEMNRDI